MVSYHSSIADCKTTLESLNQNIVFICDENTLQCVRNLNVAAPVIILPAGEIYKTIESCEVVWQKLINLKANKQTTLICVGGGVICDLGGFAAATFMRGISHIHIPTSLLAMVDAAIGGKTGINFLNHKNYIGQFQEAQNTLICFEFLETLPQEEFINGFVEMLKHGLLADKLHFYKISKLIHDKSLFLTLDHIKESVKIKLAHTSVDLRDKGIRKRLNFGHTIGHAIENASLSWDEPLAHGLAVAIGIVAESYLSHLISDLDKDQLQVIQETIFPFVKKIIPLLPPDDTLLNLMSFDKKNENTFINFTLLSGIGVSNEDFMLTPEQILPALRYIRATI